MSRKYVCDNCGKEFAGKSYYDEDKREYISALWALGFSRIEQERDKNRYWAQIGEYCEDCRKKIEARIKEGV